jgi:murein DD-endopeptidase MepM/ murein hydrolase activator NlpD
VEKKETYRIKTGDTLGAIARKNGVSVEKIASDNKIKNKNHIFPGQEIIISKPLQAPKKPPVAMQTETLKSLSIFQSEDVFFEYFRSHIALPENSELQKDSQIEIKENPAITSVQNARKPTENHGTQENGKTKETHLRREKIKVTVEKYEGIINPELISDYTMKLLEDIGHKIELEYIRINSGIRPPERQAVTMYQNIKNYGTQSQRDLYGAAGKAVISVFEESAKQGNSQSMTISLMQKKIELLSEQGLRVSKHCVSEKAYSRLNVIDVSHKIMPSIMRVKFEEEIRKLKSIGKVSCFITPGEKSGEPAYHIEIPQP